MSTTTFRTIDSFGPILVSELPPLTVIATPRGPGLLARFGNSLLTRRDNRLFERAMLNAGPNEQGDLLAASRRG